MLYGGDWLNDVCSNTMLQRNCYDAYSFKKEIALFKKQRNKHDAIKSGYIEEFVWTDLMRTSRNEHVYYLNDDQWENAAYSNKNHKRKGKGKRIRKKRKRSNKKEIRS